MKTHTPALILIPALLFSTSAHASCRYLVEGLNAKMKEYRSHRDENQKNQLRLLQTEENCKARGKIVSERAAKISEALTCQAQQDASSLDSEIQALGQNCEGVFFELKGLQENLRLSFEDAKNDLDEAVKMMNESDLLQQFCSDDIKVAKTMAEAFVKLETNIVYVKTHATTGEQDYSSLKKAGQALAERTKALNTNCGAGQENIQIAAGLSKAGAHSFAQGSGVPKGKSIAPSSDITGSQKAIADGKAAEALIQQR